jgi:nitroreductase
MADAIRTILSRTSVRRYDGTSLDPGIADHIRTTIRAESLPGPFGVTPRFALVSAEEIARIGRLGTYGVIRGAGDFVVGSVTVVDGAMEDFGYRMEGIVLAATALGLGTCWLGGTFRRSAVARILPLEAGEVVPAVTPIGRASNRGSLVNDVIRAAARSSSRLPFDRIFFAGSFDRPLTAEASGRWANVLECVRRGPSASNKQPWRVVLDHGRDGERLHLYLAENKAYNSLLGAVRVQRIDMGIAMRHVAEAAADLGMTGKWTRLSVSPVYDAPEDMKYIATWT